MISQTAEYALRAVVAMAVRPEETMLTRDLAVETQVPAGYLAKVLQSLGRAGLVKSQPGKGGGFLLTRPIDSITLYDVVEAVDPLQRIRTCPLGLANHGVKLCALHKRLDNAMRTVEETFKATSMAELLAERNASKPLCRVQSRG
jgi:Rrf2 family protein